LENNEKEMIPLDSDKGDVICFSPKEEKTCFINLRSQVIKLLYMIEAEEKGEQDIDLWFEGFMFELISSNALCHNKLTKVVVKIHGLYDKKHYKEMTHAQIKRQIMESRGILTHLIGDEQ
jgi:hypothetical protein